MNFHDGDYTMKKKYCEDMGRRVRIFFSVNDIRQAVQPVLVTTYD